MTHGLSRLNSATAGIKCTSADQKVDFFLLRVHETSMKESFSAIDRYLLWQQCNYTKHFQMNLIDSVECFG